MRPERQNIIVRDTVGINLLDDYNEEAYCSL
jgi:hypothetical protein